MSLISIGRYRKYDQTTVVCYVSAYLCLIPYFDEDVGRVGPKFGFGFGYGAETDLTYGIGLVSATAKVQWHKFAYGRNITPQRRNCKIGANCNTVEAWEVNLLAVGGQGSAYASWYRRPETW